MDVNLQEHPSHDQLLAFAEGRLENVVTEQVADHVEACDQCAEHVNGLDIDAESILFQLPNGRANTQAFPEDVADEFATDDRLELQDVIGSGGMGVVYRAWQPNINRHVAVKQLHIPLPLPQQDPGSLLARERFEREIRALGSVRHPHLASIYTSGVTDEGRLFYSMELIEGANLSVIFRTLLELREQERHEPSWRAAIKIACATDHDADNTSITESEKKTSEDFIRTVVEIVGQIAMAVQTLHAAGIIHRDIKPGNIMVSATGDHATLMDLGLAGLLDDQEVRLTHSGLIAGSMPYISPEQFRGDPPSRSGDIYNLGVVLWELLTLRRLFRGTKPASDAELMNRILHDEVGSIREHRADVSPDLEAVVLKCLEKQPGDRYPTVGELIADLNRCTNGDRVTAARRDTLFRIRNFLRRHRQLVMGIVGLFALQTLLLAGIYWNQPPREPLSSQNEAVTSVNSSTPIEPAPVINDGSLVAYWSGEGTGSTVRDASENGNNGALIGDTVRDRGVVGRGFSFDGVGDYIHFGRSSKWDFLHDGSALSITGYLAPASSNMDGGILSTIDETSTAAQRHGFCLRLDGARRLEFHIQGVSGKFPTGAKSETVLEPEVFTAFAVTFDGQTTQLYLNGELAGAGDVVAPFVGSTAPDALSMGSIGTTSGPNGQPFTPFEGMIDEVQIYNRALSESEVAFLSGYPALENTKALRVVASTFFADGGSAAGTSISATHNSEGMGAEFPAFPAVHSADPADALLTASSYSASLHYDFGKEQAVNQIRLWNYHGAAYGLEGNGRGAKDIRVYWSNDEGAFHEAWHDSWELLTAFTAARAPADGEISPYGEEHSFDEQTCRFIRLQVDTNYGSENVGLAEVQFLATKPSVEK